MAVRYFGIERGAQAETITQGSSTTSKTIELTIDLADTPSKEDVLLALEKFEIAILKNIWPPA